MPLGLWAIVQRCLTKEPEQRYQRASEIQAALEAVQAAAIVSADAAPDVEQPRTTVLHSVKQVRQHINIFVGDENVRYTGGLTSPLTAECEISIVPAVSGG